MYEFVKITQKFIPNFMWPSFVCYVIYDRHPKDTKKIDITICLRGGKVVELFQRECVSSIKLPDVSLINEIQILRNNNGELYYLVSADSDIIILSSKDQLSVHQRFSNVTSYEVCDPECNGEAKLMITTDTSTLFISFADFKEISHTSRQDMEHTKPVISALAKKLIEAKFNLDSNEKTYKNIEKLRQHASYLSHGDCELLLKTSKPIITFCNKKIVILLEVENPFHESLKKVCLLIHNSSCNSVSYTSKVYDHLNTRPYYKETEFGEIRSKCKASIVAVIDIAEFKNSISSRIDFNVIVSYERLGKNYLQPFDDVHISAADVMGKNFDVFNRTELDERNLCMAMLSTTVKTILYLKQNRKSDLISLSTIFSYYLKMDILGERNVALLGESKMVAMHKNSPHHILHGIMIVYDDVNKDIDINCNEINHNIHVYTRCESQVLALIHFIYDEVPLSLIITTPNIRLNSHDETVEENAVKSLNYNYTQSANSLLKQSSMTLEYMDNCLKEMNKSKSVDKTNIQIDLFAMGREEFVKYRNNMLAETENFLEKFVKSTSQSSDGVENMDID